MNISIVDDNKNILDQELNLLKSILSKEGIISEITTFTSGDSFLFALEDKMFDLILLDIEMPDITGIDIAKIIRKKNKNSLIIFITSHLEFAIDSYELNIFRYIPKSRMEEKLPLALKDAIKIINLQNKNCYTIQTKTRFQKIPLNSILYIYKDGKNSVFVTEDDSIKVRKPLAAVFSEINCKEFFYIDKGVIVNLLHIIKIKDNMAVLKNNEILSVSRNHINELKSKIHMFWEENLL
ncbi:MULTISPECIES: LytR/AlgR family response regulator transcription factor [unclassified Bacillus (in: firmicutes)]|uniref:LytR/AlgR family response regulator transcription factor n=1 Tax=unclassified Bacillus (in: firmicutes) TaxID=185979 RepID=UPI003D24A935